MDMSRQIIASQSHRRMIDPMSLGRRARPFVIVRASISPAVASINGDRPSALAGVRMGKDIPA